MYESPTDCDCFEWRTWGNCGGGYSKIKTKLIETRFLYAFLECFIVLPFDLFSFPLYLCTGGGCFYYYSIILSHRLLLLLLLLLLLRLLLAVMWSEEWWLCVRYGLQLYSRF